MIAQLLLDPVCDRPVRQFTCEQSEQESGSIKRQADLRRALSHVTFPDASVD